MLPHLSNNWLGQSLSVRQLLCCKSRELPWERQEVISTAVHCADRPTRDSAACHQRLGSHWNRSVAIPCSLQQWGVPARHMNLFGWHPLLTCCVSCRPRLKYHMDYCMEHPEELTKVASVQKKVRALHEAAPALSKGVLCELGSGNPAGGLQCQTSGSPSALSLTSESPPGPTGGCGISYSVVQEEWLRAGGVVCAWHD